MNFSQGHSGTKVQCESRLRSQAKMGEIHELFVLPLSLVWFAGATPDRIRITAQFFYTAQLYYIRTRKRGKCGKRG